VHRLVRGDRQPVADEAFAHLAAEPPGHVEREVDRDELDVGERVEQGDSAREGLAAAALGHRRRRQQLGPTGTRRAIGHRRVEREDQRAPPPAPRRVARRAELGGGFGGQQRRPDRLRDGIHSSGSSRR